MLAGLIGRNCLRISGDRVNMPPVKFTASDNPLEQEPPRSAQPDWVVFRQTVLNSREEWLPPGVEQDETNHNKAIMFNILKPPTGTSVHVLTACSRR